MRQKDPSQAATPVKNRRGIASGIASYWLAILGFVSSLGLGRLFCRPFFFLAMFFAVVSLVTARRRPRRRLWFLRGTVGFLLGAAGLIFMIQWACPSAFRTKIPPLDYARAPLPQILQDFCRFAQEQQRSVRFSLHERALGDQTVTLRTRRRMGLKKALQRLTESAECSFTYVRCGTCGRIIGPIWIFRERKFSETTQGRLIITAYGIWPEGLWREEWEGEKGKAEPQPTASEPPPQNIKPQG